VKTATAGTLGGKEVKELTTPEQHNELGKMMAVDNDGFIWFTATREAKVVKIDPKSLAMTSFNLPRGSEPYSLDVDSKGTLWITTYPGVDRLIEFNPKNSEAISHIPPTRGMFPNVVVDRKTDTVYFSQPAANLIVSYRAGGSFKEYPIPTAQSFPGRVDIDSRGNVWFPELYGDKLGLLDPTTGKISEWDLPSKDGVPAFCRVGKDDTIWVSMPMSDKLASFKDGQFKEYRVPTTKSIPSTSAQDAEGIVWFTEGGYRASEGGNKIGRLDPATGIITELPLPTPKAEPTGMLLDKNGVLWFQETKASKIGRIALPNR
jgi:virginiamycin B lyase